jgi:hypothetical protein
MMMVCVFYNVKRHPQHQTDVFENRPDTLIPKKTTAGVQNKNKRKRSDDTRRIQSARTHDLSKPDFRKAEDVRTNSVSSFRNAEDVRTNFVSSFFSRAVILQTLRLYVIRSI